MQEDKFGNLIKEIRRKYHLTQKDLADKYHVTYQAVSKWENGKNLPDVSILKAISHDYNVSLDDLIDGNLKENKNRNRNKNENKIKKKNKLEKLITFFLIIIFILFLIFMVIFSENVYAATPKLVSKMENAFKDIEGWILKLATPAAAVAVGTGIFMKKFSFGDEERIRTGKKIIRNSLFSYAFILAIDLILAAIKSFI